MSSESSESKSSKSSRCAEEIFIHARLNTLSTRLSLADRRIADLESKLKTRIKELESALTLVLSTARGDGREATTWEFQTSMRAAAAVLAADRTDSTCGPVPPGVPLVNK